jgi:prepilin signal peptidase PulO-like enzyme (type II secretory pathway)
MAWRLYNGESVWGRSHCPSCNKMIAWFDNIPLFAWLNLRGKCRQCGKAIPSQYFWAELSMGILFLLAFLYRFNFMPADFIAQLSWANYDWHLYLTIFRDWVLISFLFLIFIMDLKWFVVADVASMGGALSILILNLLLGVSWQGMLWGALIGAGFFFILHGLSQGAWMGAGDIFIGLLMGIALGWQHLLLALMLAVMIAALWGIGLVLAGKRKLHWRRLWHRGEPSEAELAETALPFGPFLTLATLIVFYFGVDLLSWYWHLIWI